jgi:signal transduction histidine kinase
MTDRIDALGGTLELTSTPGKGTRVTGSLPIGSSATADAPPETIASGGSDGR